MRLAKHLISSGFLNISFSSGTIDPLTVDIFLNVFGVGCNDGMIALALLLKIVTRFKSHLMCHVILVLNSSPGV